MIKIIREDCYATVEAFQNAIQPFMEAGWILCPYVGGMLAFETAAHPPHFPQQFPVFGRVSFHSFPPLFRQCSRKRHF